MKILLFDIENAPSTARIWGCYGNDYIDHKMIIQEWFILCWCAKWLNDKNMFTGALPESPGYKKDNTNDKFIVEKLWGLLDEADIVVAHNATAFDVKKINARFAFHNILPPSPYKVVDTLTIARRYFKFTSNKLDYLGSRLGFGGKINTGGMELWEGCMAGDKKSWKKMVEYCKNDVILLEKVYKRFLPFISNHPNSNIYNSTKCCCPKCGSGSLQKRGFIKTITGDKQRYKCNSCGGWCHEAKVIKNA